MKLFTDTAHGDGFTHAVDPNLAPYSHTLEALCGAHAHQPNRLGVTRHDGTYHDVTCPVCYADLTGRKTK